MTSDAQIDAPAPALPLDEVRALVQRRYGLSCTPSALTSEWDQNLLLHAETGERYLLKISNPSEPREVIALHTAALLHLALAAPEAPSSSGGRPPCRGSRPPTSGRWRLGLRSWNPGSGPELADADAADPI